MCGGCTTQHGRPPAGPEAFTEIEHACSVSKIMHSDVPLTAYLEAIGSPQELLHHAHAPPACTRVCVHTLLNGNSAWHIIHKRGVGTGGSAERCTKDLTFMLVTFQHMRMRHFWQRCDEGGGKGMQTQMSSGLHTFVTTFSHDAS